MANFALRLNDAREGGERGSNVIGTFFWIFSKFFWVWSFVVLFTSLSLLTKEIPRLGMALRMATND